MDNATNVSIEIEYLHMDMCHMIDLPPGGRDCSRDHNPSFCIDCKIPGMYFSGESLHDYGSSGHVMCLIMGILTVAVGVLGIFTNSIIIAVLKNRKKYQPFDFLLLVLACFDLYCCGAVILVQTARMALYGEFQSMLFEFLI